MKLTFHFDEPGEANLRAVNQALAALRVGKLDLVNLDGSVTTQKQYQDEKVVSIRYWYNVMDLELDIDPADDGDYYRIDAEAIPQAQAPTHEEYMEAWRAEHSHRQLRVMQSIRFGDTMMAFVVVSYQPRKRSA